MRVVLDTNVLVSGLMSPDGTCRQLLRLLALSVIEVYLDTRILAEYETVLTRQELEIPPEDIAAMFEVLRESGELVVAPPLSVRLPDPSDLPFLEVAAASEAVLVTGNGRHFPAQARGNVEMKTPRGFLDQLRGQS